MRVDYPDEEGPRVEPVADRREDLAGPVVR
jgi:hypothetical protein